MVSICSDDLSFEGFYGAPAAGAPLDTDPQLGAAAADAPRAVPVVPVLAYLHHRPAVP